MAADGGQDLVDNPGFEVLGCGELGGEDEPVQVTFGDEPGALHTTSGFKGVVNHHPLAVLFDCVGRILVPQGGSHITAAEIHLVLMLDSSDRPKSIVSEYLKISRSHVWLLLRARIDVNSSKPRVRPLRALTHTPLSPRESGHPDSSNFVSVGRGAV